MYFVIILAVLLIVVTIVSAPLRSRVAQPDPGAPDRMADLEAAREAKYLEIRDADLDYRTGKLSDADYEAIDSVLRGEAIDILRDIDREQERA